MHVNQIRDAGFLNIFAFMFFRMASESELNYNDHVSISLPGKSFRSYSQCYLFFAVIEKAFML